MLFPYNELRNYSYNCRRLESKMNDLIKTVMADDLFCASIGLAVDILRQDIDVIGLITGWY